MATTTILWSTLHPMVVKTASTMVVDEEVPTREDVEFVVSVCNLALLVGILEEKRSSSNPRHQICNKTNHTALKCYYRFEEDYQANNKTARYVFDAYGVAQIGTLIVVQLVSQVKMTVHDRYGGCDKVHTANVARMQK